MSPNKDFNRAETIALDTRPTDFRRRRAAITDESETISEFAAWACYALTLKTVDYIGESTEESIPYYDDNQETLLSETETCDDGSQTSAMRNSAPSMERGC